MAIADQLYGNQNWSGTIYGSHDLSTGQVKTGTTYSVTTSMACTKRVANGDLGRLLIRKHEQG